jgi:hypothetical protein
MLAETPILVASECLTNYVPRLLWAGEPFEEVILPPELCVDDCEHLFLSRGSGKPSPTGRCEEHTLIN